MKKGLQLLSIALCATLFLAGCKKSEESRWQELPGGATDPSKTALTYNGSSTSGTAGFQATGPETAVITLTNVIDNYPEMAIDVTMKEASDGSFTFEGEKQTETKTKATPLTMTLKISGTIYISGVIRMEITAIGPQLFVSSYSGAKLNLKYNDFSPVGKTVVFTTAGMPTLTLNDIIPNIAVCKITNLTFPASGGFKGSYLSADSIVSVKCVGSRTEGVLNLDLQVQLISHTGLARNYLLAPYRTILDAEFQANRVMGGGGLVNFQGGELTPNYAATFRSLLCLIMPQMLNSITLEPDGTITAMHQAKPSLKFEPLWAFMPPSETAANAMFPKTGWVKSPKGLAYWYPKNDTIYLKIDMVAILSSKTGAGEDPALSTAIVKMLLTGTPEDLRRTIGGMLKLPTIEISDETINVLKSWLINGIPMVVRSEGSRAQIFLDKSAMNTLMRLRKIGGKDTSEMTYILQLLTTAGILPKDAAMAISLVEGISREWKDVSTFDIGLDLVAQ